MAVSVLADTGALLAVLDRNDQRHFACSNALRQLTLPLLTSEAVLTELFHLSTGRVQVESAWKLIRRGSVVVASIAHVELGAIHGLMSRYSDRPMDFADATLVYLAERENLSTIFTTDRNDFETYRIRGRRRFRIVPD